MSSNQNTAAAQNAVGNWLCPQQPWETVQKSQKLASPPQGKSHDPGDHSFLHISTVALMARGKPQVSAVGHWSITGMARGEGRDKSIFHTCHTTSELLVLHNPVRGRPWDQEEFIPKNLCSTHDATMLPGRNLPFAA